MSESAGANAPKPSSSVKLVLLGEAAVGKVQLSSQCSTTSLADKVSSHLQSSLVLRFVNNDFQENKEPTIGGKEHPWTSASGLRGSLAAFSAGPAL